MSSKGSSETRIAILDAARSLYEKDPTVGLATVAEKAGVSRQAIYLHFANKAELLRALHQRVNELDVEPALRQVWRASSALEALDAWIDGSAKAIPKFVALATALDVSRRVDPDIEATWDEPASGHYADCVRMAQWLADDGVLAPGVSLDDATDVIWSLTGFPAYLSLVGDRRWSKKKWKDWLRVTLRTLLVAPAHR